MQVKSLTHPLHKRRPSRKDFNQASERIVLKTLCEVLDLASCAVFFFLRERPVVVQATGQLSKLPHAFEGNSNKRICFDKRSLFYCSPDGSVVRYRLRDIEGNRLDCGELLLEQFHAADIGLTRKGDLLAVSKHGTLAIGDALHQLNEDFVNSYWHCVCESTLSGRFLAGGSKEKRHETVNNLLLVTAEGQIVECKSFANSTRRRISPRRDSIRAPLPPEESRLPPAAGSA